MKNNKQRGNVSEIVLVFSILGLIVWFFNGLITEEKARQALPEKEYCLTYADDTSAPLKCYKYFGVQQVGTHMEGKVSKPTLVPINQ